MKACECREVPDDAVVQGVLRALGLAGAAGEVVTELVAQGPMLPTMKLSPSWVPARLFPFRMQSQLLRMMQLLKRMQSPTSCVCISTAAASAAADEFYAVRGHT